MFFKRKKKRLIVLGIDGVPFSFIKKGIEKDIFPNIKKISEENSGLKKYNSVYPTVSSVAWTSYMTGKNPGEHSIFGFVDRELSPFKLKIPLAKDRTAETLWKHLSGRGKKVLVMNVPVTYPPENVNGILISGFLTPDIQKGVKPESVIPFLKKNQYIIDANPRLGHTDRKKFMEEIHLALDRRMKIFMELLKKDSYDLGQCHIMETDRINHFYWDDYINDGEFINEFNSFYKKLDDWIGKVYDSLNENDMFIVLSDHGFCGVKYNVQLNHFLEEEGYLSFEKDEPQDVTDMSPESRAYSLIPGRIFMNLKGREEKGSVPEDNYEALRKEIKEKVLDIEDPDGNKIIKNAFFREEIYSGPFLNNAADIIVHPEWGYDLKGNVKTGKLCHQPAAISGMHTYNDAVIFTKNVGLGEINSIMDPLRIAIKEL